MDSFHALEHQLKALANVRRLRILSFLKKKEGTTVSTLARELRVTPFAVSQHLRILRSADVVKYTRRGKYVFYRLFIPQKQPVKQILAQL